MISLVYDDRETGKLIEFTLKNTETTWDEHLDSMVDFLRAIGYVIPPLEYVEK